jgi:predicted nucleic acid-binding Zn ribbon protein
MPIYSYKCEQEHVTDHLCPMLDRNKAKQCKVCRADAHLIIVPVKVALDPSDPAFTGTWLTWERKRVKQMKQQLAKREG